MNLTYCKKLLVVPFIVAGVFLALAVLFSSLAMAADEAQVQAAIKDLSSATGQNVTSGEQAKSICNNEQYLDTCAEIGKKYNLYTSDEVKQVDAFLKEVKGKVLEDIKSCSNEECLFRVANELSKSIQAKNPTLATNLNLTTKIVEEKKAVVEAAKEVGVNFKDCETLDPDTAPVDLLRKCVRLSKDTRVQKYIPQENRALVGQFDDSTVKLREALSAGKYKCGDNTLEGCGNYCLKPDITGASEIPPVCKQIASEIFGADGVKELENAHKQVGQVKDYYSKKFILTLPDGKELVGEGQIRKACDQAFSSQNIEIAKACGNFAVKNGFAGQAEVERGIKLMESFVQKGQNVNFDQCLTNPTACRDFIPADQQKQFDAGSQIFQIMKTEIGFDPSLCERGAVDETIGTKCSEGSKRALVKIESLGLANQSKEARLIIEDIKSHISEGENFNQKKDQFRQVFQQKGGPGGCKSESECFAYCSDSTHGAECISFGSQQGISGFRGQEAVQRFNEYNQNLQKPGLTPGGYRPFSPGGDVIYPPGQFPGFNQPGPGFSPPPGTAPDYLPYYPPYPPPYPGSGPVGPSSECLAAIQSGDFVKAKTVCTSSVPPGPLPSVSICPLNPYIECPTGQYRESFRNNDGCWIDGPCKPAPTYSSGPYPTYSPYPTGPYPTPPVGSFCGGAAGVKCPSGYFCQIDGTYPDAGGKCVREGGEQVKICPSGQWWDYTYNTCTSSPACGQGLYWDTASQSCKPTSGSSCSLSLVKLLGDGCHQMFTDFSGRTIFCDGPMTKSAKEGDTATKVGCYSEGTTYSPYPTTTGGVGGIYSCFYLNATKNGKYPGYTVWCEKDYFNCREGSKTGPSISLDGLALGAPSSCEGGWPTISPSPYPTSSPYPTYSPYPTGSPGGKPQCSDGIDNDKDGKTDYPADPSCFGSEDNDEYYPITGISSECIQSPAGCKTESECLASKYYWYNSVCNSAPSVPNVGSCPSGYHSHSDSGGFCMNDQENYGGICYNSAGTSKITCPTQPTYSPYPSSSPTSGGSCPSGAHTMYINTGDYCMSDADLTKCGPLNSTSVSSFGSCSGYQTTATYSPPPATYSPGPSASYTPPPSCPSGQWWDYTTNSCKLTTTPSPSTTTSYTPYPTTEYTPPPTYSPPPATYSPPPPTSVLYPHYLVAHCQQLGRTWNGSMCQANGLFARFYENNIANILRLFYVVP